MHEGAACGCAVPRGCAALVFRIQDEEPVGRQAGIGAKGGGLVWEPGDAEPGEASAVVRVVLDRDAVLEDADVGPSAERGDERIVCIEAELPGESQP